MLEIFTEYERHADMERDDESSILHSHTCMQQRLFNFASFTINVRSGERKKCKSLNFIHQVQ